MKPPGAEVANEGPPADEPDPSKQKEDRTSGDVLLKISGPVDPDLVSRTKAKMTSTGGDASIDGGNISLSFIAETTASDEGVRSGRIEVSPLSLKHTLVFTYADKTTDQTESACTLTGGKFITGRDGEMTDTAFGAYLCNVVMSKSGKPVGVMQQMAGPLSLHLDKPTGSWYLTFMNGPNSAIWRLK
jgi:hypothetical protein